jgi:hypothetical protein
MATKKAPERVNDDARPKFGPAAILGQSDRVVEAFGPRRGFALIMTALLAGSGVFAGGLFLLAKGLGRVL